MFKIIKLTKKMRLGFGEGGIGDGEIGDGEIEEGGCEETYHCKKPNLRKM
jgi:hypothetical protein